MIEKMDEEKAPFGGETNNKQAAHSEEPVTVVDNFRNILPSFTGETFLFRGK